MISVVIPYYQREAGILRRALQAVVAQQGVTMPIRVLVVDDASPVSADGEVQAVALRPGVTIEVHRQANAGPGAARNTGLELAGAATRYVAFLDSDDVWTPDHLQRALHALEAGNDFFFANLYQLDQTVDGFSRAGRIHPPSHPVIEGPYTGLHRYQGDMFDQIMRGNVIGTSTVVYRFEGFAGVRFRVDLTRAGEDYLFWMSLVHAGVRIGFSAQVEATYGRGVNIYSGAQWGSDEYFIRVRHEMTYRKATSKLFDVTAAQREHLDQCEEELRRGFAGAVIHRLRHGPLPWALLREQVRLDPPSLWAVPGAVWRRMRGKQ